MTGRPVERPIDFPKLRLYLRVLGVPNRLELLRKLQVPHTLGEIILPPGRREKLRSPDRPISRQAVEGHLRKLEELGIVASRQGEQHGRAVTEYLVNHGRLFVVADELRRLSLIRPAIAGMTVTSMRGAPTSGPSPLPEGPALVLANGPLEGTIFPLEGLGPWMVGREKGLAVPLPYDPFISKENARVSREGSAFFVQALPGARNGTRVNWRLLAEGETVRLKPGDAIGVGRSLLFLRGV